jgi:murein L,D-transpeptidase YafK
MGVRGIVLRVRGVVMVSFARTRRAGLVAIAGLATLLLASCSDFEGKIPKHLAPLDRGTKALIEKKGMEQRAPILIRIFKEESILEIWKLQKATKRYAFLKDYEICKWSGVLGPKLKEGDRQAPEGFYTIRPAQMNPNSSYHLSFNLGYPNAYDQAHGRTGSELMVHGACSSRGCYSMTDEQVQEIYTLGRLAFEGGQRDFQVQAFPFRMTPENMARHRHNPNMDFWRMLKEGYDHFEVVRLTPKVDVCEGRYVFNSVPTAEGVEFIPTAACPPMSVPEPIRIAVAQKQAKDDQAFLQLAAALDRREGRQPAAVAAAMPAPMSVAGAAIASQPAVPAAPQPEPATTASIAAPPTTAAVQAQPALAVQQAGVATAYAPVREQRRGFFSRVLGAINPF